MPSALNLFSMCNCRRNTAGKTSNKSSAVKAKTPQVKGAKLIPIRRPGSIRVGGRSFVKKAR